MTKANYKLHFKSALNNGYVWNVCRNVHQMLKQARNLHNKNIEFYVEHITPSGQKRMVDIEELKGLWELHGMDGMPKQERFYEV